MVKFLRTILLIICIAPVAIFVAWSTYEYILEPKLCVAAGSGKTKVVKELIAASSDINQFCIFGTPLGKAAKIGNHEIVRILIAAGADVNLPKGYNSPLYQALYGAADQEVFNELINAGADVNQMGIYSLLIHDAFCLYNLDSQLLIKLIKAGARFSSDTIETMGSCDKKITKLLKNLPQRNKYQD